MKSRVALVLSVLILAGVACQALSFGADDSPTQERPTSILFQDDFSDANSGWDRATNSDGTTDYFNGVYRILVNTTSMDIWANPGLDFRDVRLEVDATKTGGDDNNDFGVICRYQDNRNFYQFLISSDGYYAVIKIKDGSQIPIGSDAMQPSEFILQGDATNHIRADCKGDRLSLYVNNEKLVEVQDADFPTGDVGLVAGSFDIPGTDIHFDNFMVMQP